MPDKAACSDRLDLVDAAYKRRSLQATQHLRKLCRQCPIAHQCLDWAMANPEWGVWGATTPNERTRAGGASAYAALKAGQGRT